MAEDRLHLNDTGKAMIAYWRGIPVEELTRQELVRLLSHVAREHYDLG